MTNQFLGDALKKVDYDAYLLALFMPVKTREALWALFLLNHEVAKTRDMVTDTNLGFIRLQWWRDEIAKIYRHEPCGNIPVLSTLAPIIYQQNIPQTWFDDVLYAREFDLQGVAPANWMGLCNYAEFITAPLVRIALKIMGEDANEDEIRLISRNYGLQKIIRGVPYALSRGQNYLPEDMLNDMGLSSQKIIDYNHKEQIVEVIKTLFSHLGEQKRPKNKFLYMMQKITDIHLNKIRKNQFDVFLPVMHVLPSFFALRLWLASQFRKI